MCWCVEYCIKRSQRRQDTFIAVHQCLDGSACGIELDTGREHLIIPKNSLTVDESYEFGVWIETFDGRRAEAFVTVFIAGRNVPRVSFCVLSVSRSSVSTLSKFPLSKQGLSTHNRPEQLVTHPPTAPHHAQFLSWDSHPFQFEWATHLLSLALISLSLFLFLFVSLSL
jgi:hypothetical protein